MKKIMFNDKYGLTQAVLDGRKTMTRRVITLPNNCVLFSSANRKNGKLLLSFLNDLHELVYIESQYQVGEVVAVAQSYNDCLYDAHTECEIDGKDAMLYETAGWDNKMFVKAELMPHHIRITNIRVERLQDISDEDCLREGIIKRGDFFGVQNVGGGYNTARGMFEWLIDKVSCKGTWERNPYVFVYEFEKVD